ncbi:MAG: nitroreductase family deazaflavin-dependent oxidoreductase [Acidimicrobiales bacterium]|nr:nitroreductase family deazaflavin-dependent oxidoreductase [Acidimicrobiales bacterium]
MPKFAVDGAMSRAVRKMATSRWFRKVAPSVVPPLDRAVHKITKGRVSVSGAIVPNLVLTTIGRRSGQPRQSPLACVPDGDGGWYVVGSNFGRESHPLWTENLLAEPSASVDYRRQTFPVVAELLDDDAKAEVWPQLIAVWPAYDDYVEVSGRNLRVFHLTRT